MHILTVFNHYRARGGETVVFEREAALLAAAGHRVDRHEVGNAELDGQGRLGVVWRTLWNRAEARRLAERVRRDRPDVVHVHNFFAVLSPAVLRAAHGAGAAVVLTLHNYRLLCVNGLLMRDRHGCEDCVGAAFAWRGAIRGCYRASRAQSAVVAAMVALHRLAGTWRHCVDRYIALTDFGRRLFVRGGLPAGKVVVKPHFIPDLHAGEPLEGPRAGALFVGRLEEEKGIAVLAQAWRDLDLPLRVIGEGELAPLLRASDLADRVEVAGHRSTAAVAAAMRGAEMLVVSSLCYETFGLVVLEAFAAGLPVVAPDHGAFAEIVRPGETGLLYRPGDPGDLRDKIRHLMQQPVAARRMGAAARADYLTRFTPEPNLEQLLDIYRQARQSRQDQTSP